MIREMEYIYTIYQEKSFSKAANRLLISQPALSATVKKVEDTLKVKIFDRSTKPLSLTEAGEYYIQAAQQILGVVKELEKHIDTLNNDKPYTLKIGSSTFFCCYVLPQIIQGFHRLNPNIHIELVEGAFPELFERIADESLDLLLCISQETNFACMKSVIIGEETLLLAVPASFNINQKLISSRLTFTDIKHRLNALKNSPKVNIANFKDEPFIMMNEGNDIYKRGMEICHEAGFNAKISMVPTQQLTAFHLACADMGVCFVRDKIVQYIESTNKVYFYILDTPLITRSICISYHKKREIPPALTKFINYIIKRKV